MKQYLVGQEKFGPDLIKRIGDTEPEILEKLAALLKIKAIDLDNNDGVDLLLKIRNTDLDIRKELAVLLKLLYPEKSSCRRCGIPWIDAEWHSTSINAQEGLFPLCKKCWEQLSIKERLPFYRELFDSRLESNSQEICDSVIQENWEEIEKAVLAGK